MVGHLVKEKEADTGSPGWRSLRDGGRGGG